MSDPENNLQHAASAYLRSARHQPIRWHEWGEEAFAQARSEAKPVLLDIGAVWCHWCHVMDRESYENAETAAVINEHFIAVKVDRDERPDVDARYQAAVAAISGQGGWPLTAFLTPEGKPFFGGTYFPPDERMGRPGFRRVLLTMADAYRNDPAQVSETGASVLAAIEHNESFNGRGGDLEGADGMANGEALLEKLVASAVGQFDSIHGGFGSQPKFPHAGALDLLLDAAARTAKTPKLAEQASIAASVTLQRMAAGGIYDQLAGGFHRYSVDERWVVPHFEKMAYDNAELLRCYAHAYQSFAAPEFARVARDILRWMNEVLSDREQGGFYASQDADDSLDDDGDYFTWTLAEARAVLTAEELKIAAPYFDIAEIGDMHHNPAKNVLHVKSSLAAVATSAGVDVAAATQLLSSAKARLLAARLERRTPYIDRTVYAGWNGLCISAYLSAARALRLPEVQAFALKSLDRVLAAAMREDGSLTRVVVYSEADSPVARPTPAVLEDYAFVAAACLDAFEAKGEQRYFNAAQTLAETLLREFYDELGGAFFDTSRGATQNSIGALSARRKPLQDSPTPAGNSVAADVLLRLFEFNGRQEFHDKAVDTLETFAGIVEHFGLYAASYGIALRRLTSPAVQVCVIGSDALAEELASAATARYAINKTVLRFTPSQLSALPPSLAETLPAFIGREGSFAVVCSGNTCQPPVDDPDALIDMLASAS
jgi:uncharacterized protein YyaL (SSP411 family)